MNQSLVTINKDNGVATVTLNRPEKLNALNREMRGMFCRAMQEIGADPSIGAVIITGAGRAFWPASISTSSAPRACVRPAA